MVNYLKPIIDKKEATFLMNDFLYSNWWKKINRSVKLVSIEKVYLPFWCFDYEAITHTVSEGMQGRIAIEPLSQMNAILPIDLEIETTEADFFPIQKPLYKDSAQRLIYWELFAKEKRREKIEVEILDQWLIHVPYWIGYTHDRNGVYDIVAVDALNGKVDIPIKDTALSYLCEIDEGLLT
ncbi:hypothetical protein ACFOLA_06005 [Salinicoccus hispanicus]|uniref:Uncharacterized protein n=1 Tax=Salinicoccus hispanicus TaxID=157225 RepID=A0A6N8U4B7_9STAP|nr:hypothetical protein [Salinicoccus hispanicus]MXQ51315.1 hypothetical protein [Salinicoccus hispanicus]